MLTLLASFLVLIQTASESGATIKIVLAGDSTVTDTAGWGIGFAEALTPSGKCINLAAGGRSSKSFRDEGRWQKVLDEKPNVVLIQFGHNDQPGKGPARETDPKTSYRDNLRRYVKEARDIGAKPVLVTSLSRRAWDASNQHIASTLVDYAQAVKDVGAELKVPVIDLHAKSISIYEQLGRDGCTRISPRDDKGGTDHTHLNLVGSKVFGKVVANELREVLPELATVVNSTRLPVDASAWQNWFDQLSDAKTTDTETNSKIRIVLIGDSTVKNGRGTGEGGLWGWGQLLHSFFDESKVEVENRALGGRSSRTFLTEGLWEKSLERLRPGDFVFIQFGHNDGGTMFDGDRPRASIKGNGDETKDGVVGEKAETVHSFGWYLRTYCADAKAKGATPVVMSLVPRNRWEQGRVIRSDKDYAKWAKEAAMDAGALFIDLNEIVAKRYETMGADKVAESLFTKTDWTHTTQAGARVNAESVVEGLKALEACPLKDFLLQ